MNTNSGANTLYLYPIYHRYVVHNILDEVATSYLAHHYCKARKKQLRYRRWVLSTHL